MKKKAILIFVVLTLSAFLSTSAFAYDKEIDVVADILFARPVGVATIVLGTATFILALPFAIPSQSVGRTARVLIANPFKFTFLRPIGDFENMDNQYSGEPIAESGPLNR